MDGITSISMMMINMETKKVQKFNFILDITRRLHNSYEMARHDIGTTVRAKWLQMMTMMMMSRTIRRLTILIVIKIICITHINTASTVYLLDHNINKGKYKDVLRRHNLFGLQLGSMGEKVIITITIIIKRLVHQSVMADLLPTLHHLRCNHQVNTKPINITLITITIITLEVGVKKITPMWVLTRITITNDIDRSQ